MEPGETKILISNIAYDTYYYFAKDDQGSEWAGSGKYKFLVSKEAFNIKNANMEYQKTDNRVFRNFKKIDVSDAIRRSYTLSLTEYED
ncbi:MAG: hypothetical protein ACXVNM_01625 [Bacteroidia bacterium]